MKQEATDIPYLSTGTREKGVREESEKEREYGYKELVNAIERFGEIYERVESVKQRQMVELEKQRMQFTKDLEYQRMRLFMETQLQLHKVKRNKCSSGEAILQMLNPCNMLLGNVTMPSSKAHGQPRLHRFPRPPEERH